MTAATAARRATGSNAGAVAPADVFVIFGITGDLAKVMTFRSLYRLERRGLLTCPIRLLLDAHRADEPGPEPISLDMAFAQEGGEGPTPYEVLLQAAMAGDSKRFTRQDGVEETWRIMQPLLDAPTPVQPYAPSTWGPAAASEVVAGHGRWHEPWVA
jgi:glucose-6-phosphate 1-dehydrogenase